MFGKIIGAVAGSKLAKSTSSLGGSSGMVLGMGAAALAKRLSLPALVAVSAGGYFLKKHLDKKQDETASADIPRTPPKVEPAAI